MGIMGQIGRQPFLTVQPWTPQMRKPMMPPPQLARGPAVGPIPEYGKKQQQQQSSGGLFDAIAKLGGGGEGGEGGQGGGDFVQMLMQLLAAGG